MIWFFLKASNNFRSLFYCYCLLDLIKTINPKAGVSLLVFTITFFFFFRVFLIIIIWGEQVDGLLRLFCLFALKWTTKGHCSKNLVCFYRMI